MRGLPRAQNFLGGVAQPATLLAAGNTTLATIDTSMIDRLVIEVGVITQAFDAFAVAAQVAGSPNFVTIASIAGDFSTPVSPMVRAVGTPVTLAAGATALLVLDVRGISAVRIQASAAVDGAVATLYASGA